MSTSISLPGVDANFVQMQAACLSAAVGQMTSWAHSGTREAAQVAASVAGAVNLDPSVGQNLDIVV